MSLSRKKFCLRRRKTQKNNIRYPKISSCFNKIKGHASQNAQRNLSEALNKIDTQNPNLEKIHAKIMTLDNIKTPDTSTNSNNTEIQKTLITLIEKRNEILQIK